MAATVDQLLRLLDVRADGGGTFTGYPSQSALPRLFGGHVVGQALAAAGRTVDRERRPHSLHAYFLRAGDPTQPVRYDVATVREGRSFSTREVRAHQGQTQIFTMTASFHLDEPGLEHQSPAAPAPSPHSLASKSDRVEDWPDIYREWSSLDIRPVLREPATRSGEAASSSAQLWMRSTAPIPDDPLLHACVLACISDLTLLSVVLVPHELPPRHPDHHLASLDHAVWFHRPCRVDGWLLYDQTTPSTSNSRGLALGRILTADGTLAATVAQEGLFREHRAAASTALSAG